jgi:hypothetical protein
VRLHSLQCKYVDKKLERKEEKRESIRLP